MGFHVASSGKLARADLEDMRELQDSTWHCMEGGVGLGGLRYYLDILVAGFAPIFDLLLLVIRS